MQKSVGNNANNQCEVWVLQPRAAYTYKIIKSYGFSFRQEKIKLNNKL